MTDNARPATATAAVADSPPGLDRPRSTLSVCLFCGSSNSAGPVFLQAAADFGAILAAQGVRLVYGGGGVGLMGAAAKAAQAAGGEVLGVIPAFLRTREVIYDEVRTMTVATMHERKRVMFEQSDAFAVFPGGIGTLEEVVELSWRRLGLHAKPIVFLDQDSFWQPFFALIRHTIAARVTPPWVADMWRVAERTEDVLPIIREQLASMSPDREQAGAKPAPRSRRLPDGRLTIRAGGRTRRWRGSPQP